jgi:hypothetical protein
MLRALKFYFIYLYTPNSNPILDTGVYEVTFPDCHVDEYAANIIIENMYQQVDSDGNTHLIFQEITNHRCDSLALRAGEAKTTKGWYLQVLWKDGSSTWEPLRDLKEWQSMQLPMRLIWSQPSNGGLGTPSRNAITLFRPLKQGIRKGI